MMFMLRLQCLHLRERGRNGLSRWRAQSLSRAGHPKSGHDLTLPSRRSRSSISCCIFSCRDSLCDKQGGRLWYESTYSTAQYGVLALALEIISREYWWTPARPVWDAQAWLGAHDRQRNVRAQGHRPAIGAPRGVFGMQSLVLIAPLTTAPLPPRSLLLAPCSLPLWPDSGPVGEKEE